jgi:antitoxin HicB
LEVPLWVELVAPCGNAAIPNAELAKRLGISETVVRRMLNPKHDTKPERIQAALMALGKRIVVTFEDAA